MKILALSILLILFSCNVGEQSCEQQEQIYIQRIDSLEQELENYKALHEVAKEIIESDSSLELRH